MSKKIHFVVVLAEDYNDATYAAETDFSERGILCEAHGGLNLQTLNRHEMEPVVTLYGEEFPEVFNLMDIEDAVNRHYKNAAIEGMAAMSEWGSRREGGTLAGFDKWREVAEYARLNEEGVVDAWGQRKWKFWREEGGVATCFEWEEAVGVTVVENFLSDMIEPTRGHCSDGDGRDWWVVRCFLG